MKNWILSITRIRRPIMLVAFAVVGLFCITAPIVVAAGAISQNYKVSGNTDVGIGTLLSLSGTGKDTVTPADSTNNTKLIGVATNRPLLAISGNGNVQVAVSGTAQVLVSDIEGTIKVGDKIAASPIAGVGMKAVTPTQVVGVAKSTLSSVPTVNQTVTEQNGKTATIKVGLIDAQVEVGYYAAPQVQSKLSSLLPPFLQTLANAVAGRQISPLRVLSGTVALIIGFVTVMVMLYSSIRANIASIGRNPLAEAALRKGFIEVFVAAMGVLALAVSATYLILSS